MNAEAPAHTKHSISFYNKEGTIILKLYNL